MRPSVEFGVPMRRLAPRATVRAAAQASAPAASNAGPHVTPLVRRLAETYGVALASVAGTGAGGRIRKQDVLDAAGVPTANVMPAARAESDPLAAVRASAAYRNWRL